MIDRIAVIKQKLDEAITQICESSWLFSARPEQDFTRKRKLPFRKVISFMLAMGGGSLTNEMLNHFGCSADVASASAFIQQRAKIDANAFVSLFDLFVSKTDSQKRYKGLRLIAADGSDIQIPTNPGHSDSYFPGVNGQAPYNLLHLDAMYDLIQHTYLDANLCGKRVENERDTLCAMLNRSSMENVLLIADRGYENYNLMAHIQEKGWFFLIRVRDSSIRTSIAGGLDLPATAEFDLFVDLSLTTRQTKEIKLLCQDRNHYRCLSCTSAFDFLPKSSRKHDPLVFYKLPFRIVRFQITEDTYETVVTNLDATSFPPFELKQLYNMRWGIETSFRELKYTVGLLHFHAKKVECIYQEIFARLIMYNFTELITSPVVISKADLKYTYKVNFSVAVHICRQFFLGNVSPPDVEALIRRYVSPIRPGRSRPRNMTTKYAVSFMYRVA